MSHRAKSSTTAVPPRGRVRRPAFPGGLVCALLAALSVLAAYPVVEMGVLDDWSYTRTALDLVRTGHIIYNGWATAMLGWQILWGALFIKLFGYSMLVVRLSTLPLAMGCALLMFWLCTRFGLNRINAFLATCTVVLSPVFVPLAASYMTDVPGFFSILVCLSFCVKALEARNGSDAISWLALATIAGVAGGTCRQVAWLAPLVIVPSAAWQLRKTRGVIPAAIVLWIFALAAVFACSYWFAHQPYSVPEKLIKAKLQRWLIRKALAQYRDVILTLFLFSLPALVAYLGALRRVSQKVLVPLLAFVAVVITATVIHGGNGLAPFLTDIVSPLGVGGVADWHTLGDKPVVLAPLLRLALTSLTAISLCVAVAFVASRYPFNHSPNAAAPTPATTLSWQTIFYLFVPFTLCYLVVLAPRAIFAAPFDRYLIPLVGLFLIPLLRFYQEQVNERPPAFCFVVLALFWGYAVASTHDYFAMNRARLAAAQEVLKTGVPRTELQAGWELDGQTQIDQAGYIDDPRIQVPVGAYQPVKPSTLLPLTCQTQWSLLVPVIHPRYFLVFSPQSCLAASVFAPVSYSAWWPPFRRQIYIQQLAKSTAGYLSSGNSK